jgi:hypothetical protein
MVTSGRFLKSSGRGKLLNIRHSAALALVGWYLMMPPDYVPPGGKGGHYDISAQFSKWTTVTGFDTVDACDTQRMRWENSQQKELIEMSVYGKCIAADDVRLKDCGK